MNFRQEKNSFRLRDIGRMGNGAIWVGKIMIRIFLEGIYVCLTYLLMKRG